MAMFNCYVSSPEGTLKILFYGSTNHLSAQVVEKVVPMFHEQIDWCHVPRYMESWNINGTIWAQAELWGIEPTQLLNGMTKAQTTQSNQWGPSEHHDSEALGCLKTVPSGNATYALRDDLPIKNGDFPELREMSRG